MSDPTSPVIINYLWVEDVDDYLTLDPVHERLPGAVLGVGDGGRVGGTSLIAKKKSAEGQEQTISTSDRTRQLIFERSSPSVLLLPQEHPATFMQPSAKVRFINSSHRFFLLLLLLLLLLEG